MAKPNCSIVWEPKIHRINVHNRACGFFSDFLTCLAGIMYCYDNGLDFYVDWRSSLFTPKNKNIDYNIFDKYFYQEHNNLDDNFKFEQIHNIITPYGYYFPLAYGHTNPKSVYSALHKPAHIIEELEILNTDFFEDLDKNYFSDNKVLGLHKRGTDHHLHGEILDDRVYMEEINRLFQHNNFDKIFLITDDIHSFNFFKNELGNDLLTTDSFKSTHAVHLCSNPGQEIISRQVIRDAYYLSQTNYKLITRSNVSAFSLLCNLQPDNFKFLDDHIKYK